MADNVDDEQVAQFTAITGAPPRLAAQFLAQSSGNVETAVTNYYAAQEDDTADDPRADSDYVDENDDDPDSPVPSHPNPASTNVGGGRRLGDGPIDLDPTDAASASKSSSKAKGASQKKFATLGDYGASGKNEDDDDDDDKQDLFTGGEKSGLAVKNPDDLKQRILDKAKKKGVPEKEAPSKKSFFTGSARTLGGDDTPSREIPTAPGPRQAPERVERTLHFWLDGFSIDDGDLYRSDDPANANLLELIRRGRAPLRIMNVEPGQEVDVELKEHKENYVKPKKAWKAFDGTGQRLGSPTPGIASMPGSFEQFEAPSAPASTSAAAPTSSVDESQPTVTLRISLGSGTRLTSRFNTTATIGDVYDFVRRAETGGREFVLQTTFPTNELKDLSQVLGDVPEFKRGGAVVQKYI